MTIESRHRNINGRPLKQGLLAPPTFRIRTYPRRRNPIGGTTSRTDNQFGITHHLISFIASLARFIP